MTSISSCDIIDGAKEKHGFLYGRDTRRIMRFKIHEEINTHARSTEKSAHDAPPPPPPPPSSLVSATAVLPLDVFGSGSRARVAFKFPSCCCVDRQRVEKLREEDISHSILVQSLLGMAQNVNPFSSTQNTPTKATEEKQSLPKDNHAVSKRLQKELMVLMMSTEQGVSAFPEGENLFKWIGTITGPRDTVYAGLTYKLTLEFPHSYPYSAPIVRFATPCFHPNVDTGGNICLDILKDKWSALYDVRTILLSIQSLLGEPNNESPLNLEAAELWNNQTKYKKYLMEEYHRAFDRAQSNRNQQDS